MAICEAIIVKALEVTVKWLLRKYGPEIEKIRSKLPNITSHLFVKRLLPWKEILDKKIVLSIDSICNIIDEKDIIGEIAKNSIVENRFLFFKPKLQFNTSEFFAECRRDVRGKLALEFCERYKETGFRGIAFLSPGAGDLRWIFEGVDAGYNPLMQNAIKENITGNNLGEHVFPNFTNEKIIAVLVASTNEEESQLLQKFCDYIINKRKLNFVGIFSFFGTRKATLNAAIKVDHHILVDLNLEG
ncbi:MAG: hypothetical protein HQK60_10345 [Deltaproteobacteria bacterium]|nr:hypothetical protein [Deltaproteobacteria bacterium]